MNERLIKRADCDGMWLFIHNISLVKKIQQTGAGGEGDKAEHFLSVQCFYLMLKITDNKALHQKIDHSVVK